MLTSTVLRSTMDRVIAGHVKAMHHVKMKQSNSSAEKKTSQSKHPQVTTGWDVLSDAFWSDDFQSQDILRLCAVPDKEQLSMLRGTTYVFGVLQDLIVYSLPYTSVRPSNNDCVCKFKTDLQQRCWALYGNVLYASTTICCEGLLCVAM